MLIKYDPSQLLHSQLIPNTLTPAKLTDNNSGDNTQKTSIVAFAPIFVAGLQVNITLHRTNLNGLKSNDYFHLEDTEGNDLTQGKVLNGKNIDTFFRELYAERSLLNAPRPQGP